jgi:hypothetical protein
MGEVVNLRRARKRVGRVKAAARASEQRARFGRTWAEKSLSRAREEKRARDLDSHRRERASDPGPAR